MINLWVKESPPCRVQLRFEPAIVGRIPLHLLRLGLSLSRYTRKMRIRYFMCWLKTFYATSQTQQGNSLIP